MEAARDCGELGGGVGVNRDGVSASDDEKVPVTNVSECVNFFFFLKLLKWLKCAQEIDFEFLLERALQETSVAALPSNCCSCFPKASLKIQIFPPEERVLWSEECLRRTHRSEQQTPGPALG